MSYRGFGQDEGEEQPALQQQMACLAQGKWWYGGTCVTAVELATQVCEQQIGGVYDPASGECKMQAGTGLSEAAQKAACDAVGGSWNPETLGCAMPTGGAPPPGPGGQPGPGGPPPTATAGVPWKTIGLIGGGLAALYYVVTGL